MEHRPVDLSYDVVRAALSELPLGGLRVFRSIGSTNDEALSWADQGGPDLALVVADEQVAGRGRAGRTWITPAGVALAFSFVLRDGLRGIAPGRLAGLGAMAAADACQALGLSTAVKWPNDVLVNDRKIAGILVDVTWSGDDLAAAVLGIGINVHRGSAPADGQLRYPATSIEEALGAKIERTRVLTATVAALLKWRGLLADEEFVRAWEARLAFRGRQVTLSGAGQPPLSGVLKGLGEDGSLRLAIGGREVRIHMGDTHLQSADVRMK
jgi:BirA family biotin operon repressor/biotin-[acetyl-CoA-carboxylase] ligase